MTTKLVGVNTIKEGSYIVIDGSPCKAVSIQVSRPGKHGHAKMRIEGVGILDGRKKEVVMPGHDNVEVPIIEKKTAQILSVTGTTAQVMDSETFETFDMAIPEELQGQASEGVNILYWIVLDSKVMKQIKSE